MRLCGHTEQLRAAQLSAAVTSCQQADLVHLLADENLLNIFIAAVFVVGQIRQTLFFLKLLVLILLDVKTTTMRIRVETLRVYKKVLSPPHLNILQTVIPANQGALPAAVAKSRPLSHGPLRHDGKGPGRQNHHLDRTTTTERMRRNLHGEVQLHEASGLVDVPSAPPQRT